MPQKRLLSLCGTLAVSIPSYCKLGPRYISTPSYVYRCACWFSVPSHNLNLHSPFVVSICTSFPPPMHLPRGSGPKSRRSEYCPVMRCRNCRQHNGPSPTPLCSRGTALRRGHCNVAQAEPAGWPHQAQGEKCCISVTPGVLPKSSTPLRLGNQ